jgi:glycosyltransferase involved in cell wall biosynthesis
VDDGSTDNTETIVRSLSDRRVKYFKKENEERAAARNFGTKKAVGDYVTFLDSDDILCPHFLDEALKLIEKEKNPEWFHIRYNITDADDNMLVEDLIYKKGDPNKRLFFEGNFLSCIGVFLRKDIALENLFNEDRRLTTSEDHELWTRIAAQYQLKINSVVSAKLIQHENRSVVSFNKDRLLGGKELALSLILNDPRTKKFIDGYENKIKSASYSYISLHLALTGSKVEAISFALKALRYDLGFLLTRRFLAIGKHLLLTYS